MLERKKIKGVILLFLLFFYYINSNLVVFATLENPPCKFCDFSKMYVGEDKYEKFNRKTFNLNSKLNKYIVRPTHILWASIMPKYGMDRLQDFYNNIEFPKRFVSCILQKDFQSAKNETKRFLMNSTIGLGGIFDPAKRILKINQVSENMEQALCKCKMGSGNYLVMPFLSSCSLRSLLGRLLEVGLDPTVYFGSPISALIKFGLVINKTSYMQPFISMVESTFADPYDIAKKFYGMENYIKNSNLDRADLLSTNAKLVESEEIPDKILANVIDKNDILPLAESIKQISDEEILGGLQELADGGDNKIAALNPDIILEDYNPQGPVVDSMRTALFDDTEINKSFWNELSIWNHSFAKRIKTDSVNISEGRDNYSFRYILQKDKTSPVAILYPSIGEGINSHHSVVFAKILYDEGYSVVIQGSHFQWEFVKSMPKDFCPGLPAVDADYLKMVTYKILDKLERENGYNFNDRILIGTSLGAMETLFIGAKESTNNTLNISKYIALSPPIELVYAMHQADENSKELNIDSDEAKHKTAITAAKIIQLNNLKKNSNFEFKEFPFDETEGKLIVSFLIRQKLSDLIYTIENISKTEKTDIYQKINNIGFVDYTEKYVLKDNGVSVDDLSYDTSLYSISDFLKTSNNYKIYHSLDDFFVNKSQIEQLKKYSPNNIICLNNGSHLGYLYRKEFLNSFKNLIKL